MGVGFEKILNCRELGGVAVRDGRCVKHGRLLRSAHLGEATDADLTKLVDLGLRGVIDLRSSHEVGKMPDRDIPGAWHTQVEVLSLNGHLFKGMSKVFDKAASFEEGMAEFVMSEAAKMICDGFYISFVDDPDSQAAYARFFRELLSLEGAPVLWHCTQGKDRTGLAAAFILFALGADRKTVVDEFALSNDFYEEDMTRIKRMVALNGGGDAEFFCIDTLVGVCVKSFEDGLDWIDSMYGGMDSYLRNQLELTDRDLSSLKSHYLE